jgi:hypothetical protein
MKVVPTGLEVSDQGRYIFGGVVVDCCSRGFERRLLVQFILGCRLGQSWGKCGDFTRAFTKVSETDDASAWHGKKWTRVFCLEGKVGRAWREVYGAIDGSRMWGRTKTEVRSAQL